MARTVSDLALLLAAMAGDVWPDPLSMPVEDRSFLQVVRENVLPRRVAWSRNLGLTPVDPEVTAICETAAGQFEELGVAVEEAHPDVAEARDCLQVLRARLPRSFARGAWSGPTNYSRCSRYQTTLDNQLYKVQRALREVQEWRMKTIDASNADDAAGRDKAA